MLEVVAATPIEACECGHPGVATKKSEGISFYHAYCFVCGLECRSGGQTQGDAIRAWNDWRRRAKDGGASTAADPINPDYYNVHPSGVKAIDVMEHMPFNIGTAVGYLWRCGQKGDPIEDLKKARWYVEREIQKREKEAAK